MRILVEAEMLSLPGRIAETRLTIRSGELVGLIGPNGSGKTSLLHAMAGIGSPRGQVRIGGMDPWTAEPARRSRMLGFLPASRELRWPLPARDLILLGGATADEAQRIVRRLELEPIEQRRMDRLSTGERSRVLLARVLAPTPSLLLLDEPAANLDPLWQLRLMAMLQDDLRNHGQAALVAMHDLDSAVRHADRLLVMNGGNLVADGPPRAILESGLVTDIFGIERVGGEWRPATIGEKVSPPAGPRSSP